VPQHLRKQRELMREEQKLISAERGT